MLEGRIDAPFSPPETKQEDKMIRIINGRYEEQFTVPDGGSITVDGVQYRLHYIDETHFQATNVETGRNANYFHICQFGQLVIDQGQEVLPVKEST
jgi:riboflavin synthase alpha subunit